MGEGEKEISIDVSTLFLPGTVLRLQQNQPEDWDRSCCCSAGGPAALQRSPQLQTLESPKCESDQQPDSVAAPAHF